MILTDDIVHWRSAVNHAPLCGSLPDEPATWELDEVTCLVCLGHLSLAKRRKR